MDAADARTAFHLFVSHYVQLLRDAERLYLQGGPSIAQGLGLFDRHEPLIRRAQQLAASTADGDEEAARLCSQFTVTGPLCLSRRLRPEELLRWAEAGLMAARRIGDHCAEATNLANAGSIHLAAGNPKDAVPLCEEALAVARDLGATACHAESNALCYLGNAYLMLKAPLKAERYYLDWIAVARARRDRRDESIAIGNLGNVRAALGDRDGAAALYRKRLTIARKIGDRKGEADMLTNLGVIAAQSGGFRSARVRFKRALGIARQLADAADECDALTNIGHLHLSAGDERRAAEQFGQALDAARRTGDPRREATALYMRSQALGRSGERGRAIEDAETARAILEAPDDPLHDSLRRQLDALRRDGAG